MARNRSKPLILLKNETQPLSNLLIFLVNEIVGFSTNCTATPTRGLPRPPDAGGAAGTFSGKASAILPTTAGWSSRLSRRGASYAYALGGLLNLNSRRRLQGFTCTK